MNFGHIFRVYDLKGTHKFFEVIRIFDIFYTLLCSSSLKNCNVKNKLSFEKLTLNGELKTNSSDNGLVVLQMGIARANGSGRILLSAELNG